MKPLRRPGRRVSPLQREKLLRQIGLGVKHRAGELSPQQKASVTRKWRRFGRFFANGDFVAVRRKKGVRLPSGTPRTATHFLVRNAGGKVGVSKSGLVTVSKGKMSEELHTIPASAFAKNPKEFLSKFRAKLKKRRGEKIEILVTVRGYDGHTSYNSNTFFVYAQQEFFPSVKKRMNKRQATELFSIKVIRIRK